MISAMDADALMTLIIFSMIVDVICTGFCIMLGVAGIEEIRKIRRKQEKEIDYD